MNSRIAQSRDPEVARLRPYLAKCYDAGVLIEQVFPSIENEVSGFLDYSATADISARELLVLEFAERSAQPLLNAAINGFRRVPACS